MQPKPVIDYTDMEDMSLRYGERCKRYYGAFHAHTFIGMVSSEDGIHRERAKDYLVMSKVIKQKNGDTLSPDRLERSSIYRRK